jgi:hypothetical protein
MSTDEHTQLVAEHAFLTRQLARIPANAALTRASLERRLSAVRERLPSATPTKSRKVELTFKGDPVDGSRAIEAGFGGKAVSLFSDAVAMISAGFTEGGLAFTGPVPGGLDRRLRIVGHALGSFGFELELPLPPTQTQDLFNEDSFDVDELAVDATLDMLDGALLGDDEALSDVLGAVDLRAARKLAEFVKLSVDRRARFTVRAGSRRVVVPDVEAARRAAVALGAASTTQDVVVLKARLTGLRVSKPDFECLLEYNEETILGPVARGVDTTKLQALLNQSAKFRFRQTTAPNRRPRFLLLGVDESAPSEPDDALPPTS